MTDRESRERLIELHEEAGAEWDYYVDECINEGKVPNKTYDEFHADHLLANGVIVPPCKVGDMVYYPWIYDGRCGIAFTEIESIKIYVNGLPIAVVEDWKSDMPMPICFTTDDFGKTVFLTREEAEEKLKEREG